MVSESIHRSGAPKQSNHQGEYGPAELVLGEPILSSEPLLNVNTESGTESWRRISSKVPLMASFERRSADLGNEEMLLRELSLPCRY